MRATRIGLSLVTALLMLTARAAVAQTAAPPPAPAPEAPPTSPTADDGLRLHGFASASCIFNFNQPPSATNGFRVFDFTQNALRLDAAELVVEKTVSSPHDVGFRADVVVGSSIPRVSAAAGLFRDPNTGKAHDYYLQQAYASYMYDFVWKWKVTSVTSLGLSADDGHESGAAPGGGTAVWRGVAGYSRIGLSKTLALCLRGEVFDDPQGVRTGMAQQLTEVTVTPEVRLSPHALVRADIRVDRSNRFVFDARSGATATQPTSIEIRFSASLSKDGT